jgi:D-alanine-D-alanine ligase
MGCCTGRTRRREEDPRVPRHPHAGVRPFLRGRLDFSHDLAFPVIVKPAREDGSIGIEFSSVVTSIRELMERIDWLHANFDSPVLIEEFVEGARCTSGVIGNDNPEALPVIELDLSKLPKARRGSRGPR